MQSKLTQTTERSRSKRFGRFFFDHRRGALEDNGIDPLILDLNKDKRILILLVPAKKVMGKLMVIQSPLISIHPNSLGEITHQVTDQVFMKDGQSRYCAPLPNGKAVYDSGSTENFGPKGVWYENESKGNQASTNQSGKWVGEWVKDHWRAHGRVGRYYFSPYDQNEQTEWMKPGSGDGFLVWDKNGNGIIDDNTEMMSEFDVNGNKVFQNGFENSHTTLIQTKMVL